jgi:formiminotetrahydrofolate cyclodeaminase
VNVEINLGSVKDREYAGLVEAEVGRLLRESDAGVVAARALLG